MRSTNQKKAPKAPKAPEDEGENNDEVRIHCEEDAPPTVEHNTTWCCAR